VVALTRESDGDPAKALRRLGIEVVSGDVDDADSLTEALRGAWGVFSIQNVWEAGIEREEQQGKRIARLARVMGVEHFVYMSAASADRKTGIPHFEVKYRIEDEVRRLRFPSHAIVRPVFFMENLTSAPFLSGDVLTAAIKPTAVLQMVAVEDIGRVGARLFIDADEFNGREFDLAGDVATLPQAAEALSRGLGRTITYAEIPTSEVREPNEDIAIMRQWTDAVGRATDIPALEGEFGRLTKLKEWASNAVHTLAMENVL
jgi:uncharacterized protein YbjT (DUF2867 family)